MRLMLANRWTHRALVLLVALALNVPNLGAPSLWDIDEGKNAEAAREMLEADNWVVPTFNYQPRYEKPALLYWLQAESYRVFGVNEFSARLPSALAATGACLVVNELAGSMFGLATGFLAASILASTTAFGVSARFANPDALLDAFTTLTMLCFWIGYVRRSRNWFLPAGASAGLAVLAKGPIGLVLPLAVVCVFLLWERRLSLLADTRILLGTLAFVLTAAPWYIWVTADTKGKFLKGFILKDNVERFMSPMEHHSAPFFYYLVVLTIGFAPWSVFLLQATWFATGRRGGNDGPAPGRNPGLLAAYRFLWCWIVLYFVFFSLAGTKLPNYILPLYAPVAILVARFLERWRSGVVELPGWVTCLTFTALLLVGLGVIAGTLVAGGALPVARLQDRAMRGLPAFAWLGLLPVAGSLGAWHYERRQKRSAMLTCICLSSLLFVGGLLQWGILAVDAEKAPRPLVATARALQRQEDVRIACYQYFQPSLVFYCQREVQALGTESQALEFLRSPLRVFLVLPASAWQTLEARLPDCSLLARHRDFYRHCDVVVVSNRREQE